MAEVIVGDGPATLSVARPATTGPNGHREVMVFGTPTWRSTTDARPVAETSTDPADRGVGSYDDATGARGTWPRSQPAQPVHQGAAGRREFCPARCGAPGTPSARGGSTRSAPAPSVEDIDLGPGGRGGDRIVLTRDPGHAPRPGRYARWWPPSPRGGGVVRGWRCCCAPDGPHGVEPRLADRASAAACALGESRCGPAAGAGAGSLGCCRDQPRLITGCPPARAWRVLGVGMHRDAHLTAVAAVAGVVSTCGTAAAR